jgi:hypothetical protein
MIDAVDDAEATVLLASSDAIDEASLSINFMIELLCSEREFLVFSVDKEDSQLFFSFFSAGC